MTRLESATVALYSVSIFVLMALVVVAVLDFVARQYHAVYFR